MGEAAARVKEINIGDNGEMDVASERRTSEWREGAFRKTLMGTLSIQILMGIA